MQGIFNIQYRVIRTEQGHQLLCDFVDLIKASVSGTADSCKYRLVHNDASLAAEMWRLPALPQLSVVGHFSVLTFPKILVSDYCFPIVIGTLSHLVDKYYDSPHKAQFLSAIEARTNYADPFLDADNREQRSDDELEYVFNTISAVLTQCLAHVSEILAIRHVQPVKISMINSLRHKVLFYFDRSSSDGWNVIVNVGVHRRSITKEYLLTKRFEFKPKYARTTSACLQGSAIDELVHNEIMQAALRLSVQALGLSLTRSEEQKKLDVCLSTWSFDVLQYRSKYVG
ncbi:hypothetical protein [Vibrio sp. Hal054]|uniref:hypothetical protein n=1 Tax=Vibrio sp. Hal054 TaxID=3035158 RepID=UPI00301E347E